MHNHPGIPRHSVWKLFFLLLSCIDCYNQCNLIQSLKWHIECKHTNRFYCNCYQCDFEITSRSSLKVYKLVKRKIVSNINVNSVVMKQQLLSTNEWATNIGIIYQCTQCDRKLAKKYSLSKHKNIGVRCKCDNGTLKGCPTPETSPTWRD